MAAGEVVYLWAGVEGMHKCYMLLYHVGDADATGWGLERLVFRCGI